MRLFFFICVIAPLQIFAQDSTARILLKGEYKGKNIYVQNPIRLGGFCIEKILINKKEYVFEPSAALAIEFNALDFKIGDSIELEIFHHTDCSPKVLNPYHETPVTTFKIKEMKVTNEGLLTWTTENELNKFPYTIEQYMWNKWVKVGEVEGQGSANHNAYSFQLHPHSGENKVRVKQYLSGKPNISPEKKFTPAKKEIIYKLDEQNRKIIFSGETSYELFDHHGNMLKKGYGKEILLHDIDRELFYYLNYDNKNEQVSFKSDTPKRK